MRDLPFAIRREDGRSFVDQMSDGLRQAIAEGYYRPGELLPKMREMSAAAGVSMIVTNAAVARLAGEGLIRPRQRLGCVVLGTGHHVWKGCVRLFLSEYAGSY